MCEEESDLQTISYVHRMNVDELGLQQHERGYVTSDALASFSVTNFYCSCSHFLCVGTYQHKVFFPTLQVTMEFGLDKRAQTLQGLAFPLQEEAKRALQQLKQKRINYIQLVRKSLRLITVCKMLQMSC